MNPYLVSSQTFHARNEADAGGFAGDVIPMYQHVPKSPHMKAMQDVLDITAVIDSVLARDFGGKGRGIHSKLDSVRHPVPARLDRRLRYLAAVRNKALNEPEWEIPKRDRYLAECRAAAIRLLDISRQRQRKLHLLNRWLAPVRHWILPVATFAAIGGLLLLLVQGGGAAAALLPGG